MKYLFFISYLVRDSNCIIFAPTLRGGAVAARWAHNPKVAGSNPASATKKKPGANAPGFVVLHRRKLAFVRGETIKPGAA